MTRRHEQTLPHGDGEPFSASQPVDAELATLDALAGGGEMGALMRSMDWSETALGPVELWPQSLRTTISTCLNSRFPIALWWGPEMVMLYNDAYVPIPGNKHPAAMGRRGHEVWPEIWDIVSPMLEGVLARGEATWSENQLLPMNRHGFAEEAYFTFSYSPIRDESGGIGGIFTAVAETTSQVLDARRLETLREIAARTAGVFAVAQACTEAMAAVAENPADLPFCALYLLDDRGERAHLQAQAGVEGSSSLLPHHVNVASEGDGIWPFAAVVHAARVEIVEGLADRVGALALSEGRLTPTAALVLPVARPGETKLAGLLVVGLSPQLALDEKYRGFLELVAGNLATAISSARAYEVEKKRAEALAEVARAKTVFFSNVSHEFRTPLTLMLGPLEELSASDQIPEAERGQLEGVLRNSQRLLKLVNSLLDFSRVEAGRAQATFAPTDLAELTSGLASAFHPLVTAAGMRLIVDCPPLPEAVWVDRDMWEKIVLNLVSNAFKFTFEGEIGVRLQWLGSQVELSVQDTGVGIPEAELARIFNRFHRVEGARGRSFEGSGIGLALVQELARLHEGSVRVKSTLGAGTTFTVVIPASRPPLLAAKVSAREANETQVSTATNADAFLHEAAQWLNAPASVEAPSPGAAPWGHVLVADDNADMRDYVRRVLEGRFSVEAVTDGEAALNAARVRLPDIVLSDVMMPGLDGFGLLRRLRDDPGTATVPVILLSARAGEEATVEGLRAGANDYLVKPFGARELVARVEGAVRLARERTERERVLKDRADFEQQLIGIVSHDLRNPLSTILLGTSALGQRDDLDPRAAKLVLRIQSSAERGVRMVKDLLDFTQVRLGEGIPLTPRLLNAYALTRAVADEVQVSFPTRELLVETEGNGEGVWDWDRLAQVMTNLLSNALKYSPKDSAVTVRGCAEDDIVALAVHNWGTPIPPDAMERLFQPMQRLTSQPDAVARSVGLGLYIVKHIVDRHGGTVEVSSTTEAGTTFTVRLPRIRSALRVGD